MNTITGFFDGLAQKAKNATSSQPSILNRVSNTTRTASNAVTSVLPGRGGRRRRSSRRRSSRRRSSGRRGSRRNGTAGGFYKEKPSIPIGGRRRKTRRANRKH